MTSIDVASRSKPRFITLLTSERRPVRGRQRGGRTRRPVGVAGTDPAPLQAPDDVLPVVNAIVVVEATSVGSTSVANVRDTTFQQ